MNRESQTAGPGICAEEKELCRECMEMALAAGASAVRLGLSKRQSDELTLLNGRLDKVSRSGDRSLTLCLMAKGRYGVFSINNLQRETLRRFIAQAMDTVGMFAPDPFRKLPEPARTVGNTLSGRELGLYDPHYEQLTPEKRGAAAQALSGFERLRAAADGCRLVSEEAVCSDSAESCLLLDSNGLECVQEETAFEASVEITVEDKAGLKYSDFDWQSVNRLEAFHPEGLPDRAFRKAAAQIGPVGIKSGKYTVVVENEAGTTWLGPLLSALNGFSLQQRNSFLLDSLGRKMFHEGFTLLDRSAEYGKIGARSFDSEGVAYPGTPIIENGTVCRYFLNTYTAGKLGLTPTAEGCTRPAVAPYPLRSDGQGLSKAEILARCGSGILVTGFNGGNCNSANGDFSYGAEGFLFEDGKIGRPVRELVITGNLLRLWNRLLAAGADYRAGMERQVPTLAFEAVDVSA